MHGKPFPVWGSHNIRVEKVDIYKNMIVKVLLDSDITEMFIDKKIAAKHEFKLQKLNRPVMIRNVDRTTNMEGAITHQVECNMFFKGHVERAKMDICNLEKTKLILGMP